MNRVWGSFVGLVAFICLVTVTRSAAAGSVAHDGKWHWLQYSSVDGGDLPGMPMQCMGPDPSKNASDPTAHDSGLGLNVPPTWNGKVLLWMNGGGLCWDAQSCSNPPLNASNAFFPQPSQVPYVFTKFYGKADFLNDIGDPGATTPNTAESINGAFKWGKTALNRGVFDRNPSAGYPNPFKDYAYAFVPYCSGDMFRGTQVDAGPPAIPGRVPSGYRHTGLQNAKSAFQAVVSLAPSMSIVLGGGSAGGFGSIYTYRLLRNLLPVEAKVTLLSDGGVPMWSGTPGKTATQWAANGVGFFPAAGSNGKVSFTEDNQADAWGLDFASATGVSPSLFYQPSGSSRGFFPLQSIFLDLAAAYPNDTFAVIDSNNDFVYRTLWGLYDAFPPFAVAQTPNMNQGEAQLSSVSRSRGNVKLKWVSKMTSPDGVGVIPPFAVAFPWYVHHGFIFDDTTTWYDANNGSGVGNFLQTLGL